MNFHVITLYVDTSAITQTTIDANANFENPPGSTPNKDFTTEVSKGDIIIWRGESTSNPLGDTVNIRLIRHEYGRQLLGSNALHGNGGDPEMVVAITGDDISPGVSEENDDGTEKYALHFTVYNGGIRRNGTFIIDPKLLPDY